MKRDDRSPLNPFTGKEHYDSVDDDQFIAECYQAYYTELQKSQLIDNTPEGQLVVKVVSKLIKTVEEFLIKIGRYDYVDGYYEWDVHLTLNNQVNACCYPGGKILVFSGLFKIADSEEKLAFILGHEMAHALLDHGRTKASAQSTKNGVATAAMVGSFALDLFGLGELGAMTRAATNILSMGSQFFLMQPWGRDQEYEADKLGMLIAHLAGYDIRGVPKFWMDFAGDNAKGFDFFSTHPADDKRIAVMIESEEEILNTTDFYSKPILPETPQPKDEYNPYIQKEEKKSIEANTQNSDSNNDYNQSTNYQVANSQRLTNGGVNSKTCPNCNFKVNSTDKFCTNCGFKLENELKCSNCGSKVNKEDLFCTVCGNKL